MIIASKQQQQQQESLVQQQQREREQQQQSLQQSNKRFSIIDRGKSWARQLIRKSPQTSPNNTICTTTQAQPQLSSKSFTTSLSSSSSSSASSTTSSRYSTASSILSTQSHIISPHDESGYLVPVDLLMNETITTATSSSSVSASSSLSQYLSVNTSRATSAISATPQPQPPPLPQRQANIYRRFSNKIPSLSDHVIIHRRTAPNDNRQTQQQKRPQSLFISNTTVAAPPPPLPSIKPPPLPTATTLTPSASLYFQRQQLRQLPQQQQQRIDDSIIYIDSVEQAVVGCEQDSHDYHLIDELMDQGNLNTIGKSGNGLKKYSSDNSIDSSFEYIQASSSPDKDSLAAYDAATSTTTNGQNSMLTQETTQLLIEKLLNKCNHPQHTTKTSPLTTTQMLLKKSSNSSLNECIEKFSDVLLHTCTSTRTVKPPSDSLLTQLCDSYNRSSCALMNGNQLAPPNTQAPIPPSFLQLQQNHFNNRNDTRNLISLSKTDCSSSYDDTRATRDDSVVVVVAADGNTSRHSVSTTNSTSMKSYGSNNSLTYGDATDTDTDLCESWYQPNIGRDQVQDQLSTMEIGSFIIRASNSCANCYALSIRVPYFINSIGVAHYLITKIDGFFKLKGVDKEFKSLKSLVTHYSVMQEILPVTLSLSFNGSSRSVSQQYMT